MEQDNIEGNSNDNVSVDKSQIVDVGNKTKFDFSLPPVTEKTGGFIDDDVEWSDDEHDADEFTGAYVGQEKPTEKSDENLPSEIEQFRGTPSRSGEAYDPSQHAWPAKQTPKTGRWSRKKKTREESEAAPEATNALFRKAAQINASVYAAAHQIPFGDAGKLEHEKDLLGLIDALERYYLSNGLPDMSPKTEVLLQAALYTHSVSSRQPNSERVKKVFFVAYNFVASKLGFKKRKEKIAAQQVKLTPDDAEELNDIPGEHGYNEYFEGE